jgi:excisionase family DNA binding protein
MDTPSPEYLTTREVAALLRVRERKVYDLASAGEIPCRRLIGKLLFPRAEIEAWLGGGAGARPAASAGAGAAVVAGSHDPLLEWAIRESGSGLATMFDGSLDGLDRVAAGAAGAAGLHVFDPETGRWNVGVVAERLGGAPTAMIGWAKRRRGMLLGPAAAKARSLADMRGLRLVRRQGAAGADIWLRHALSRAGAADAVSWTDAIARTETEAAAMVAQDEADAAAGLEAAARPFALGFLPLEDEAFDIVVDRRLYFEPAFQKLLAFARTPACAAKAEALGGYNMAELGVVRWNGA